MLRLGGLVGEFVVEVLLAGGDFVDALFGGRFGHLGEFGVVLFPVGDAFGMSLLLGEGEEDLEDFFGGFSRGC